MTVDMRTTGHSPAQTAAVVSSPPAMAAPEERRDSTARVILALALAVGALLRLLHLGAVGLNSDEAVYAAQAASLAHNPNFATLFPVVRAHPLLVQMLVSPFYGGGHPDTIGRYLTAGLGIATIWMTYVAGRLMYGRRVGAVAALLFAVMPYAVVIGRQFLLDGPLTFFTTAGLACVAKAVRCGDRRWLIAAGAALGLSALCKETGLILVLAAIFFLALHARMWRPVRYVVGAGLVAIGLTAAYPVITAFAGGASHGSSYLVWQLTRQPNHGFAFYPTVVGSALGYVVLAVAAIGLVLRPAFGWRERLLAAWIIVPFAYFEVWPVKGFAYLLPVAPAIAVLGGRGVAAVAGAVARVRPRAAVAALPVLGMLCAAALIVPAVRATSSSENGLAGAGGTPGGRETGQWVQTHLPSSAHLITIGPSMANLIRYYSGRVADGLSVSPNPLHRNPSYNSIGNPDNAVRTGAYRYVVWDRYSATRSTPFANEALRLVERFRGRLVHTERGGNGRVLVAIYQVSPSAGKAQHPYVAPSSAVSQPSSAVMYAGYSLATVLALLAVAWAARLLSWAQLRDLTARTRRMAGTGARRVAGKRGPRVVGKRGRRVAGRRRR